jgi:beta-glucosidase
MYMADLATEPRWERIEGTFGEDADLAAAMIREITLGFQGEQLGPHSVALTTKHFPGGGPQVNGQDPHFEWGTDQHYPGNMLDYHLKPFIAAIEAGTSAIMPYYAKPVGTEFEEVAFAYNHDVITNVLRKQLGFQGIINSDTGPIDMMPITIPVSQEAVERNQSDVPGYLEPEGYALFKFGDGLSYK